MNYKLKQKIFYLILIIFIFLILNILSITFNNIVEKNILLNNESNRIIIKNYNKFNHLRDLNDKRFNYDENLNNLIFTEINKFKKNRKANILINGDSWAVRPVIDKKLFNLIKKFSIKNNLGIIVSGTSSFSPSLLSAQLDVLNNDYNIKPNIIISFIDQTDFGDEICRYKSKIKNTNNKVTVASFKASEKDGLLYNYEFLLTDYNILVSKNINFVKSYLYLKNKIGFYILKNKNNKCNFEKISSYLKNKPSKNELDYFGSVIDQYIDNVFNNYNNLVQLVIIAHPHRDHILNTYNYDVSQTIYSSIKKSEYESRTFLLKNLDKINISSVDNYFIKEDPASHLTYDYYRVFIFKVFDYLNF